MNEQPYTYFQDCPNCPTCGCQATVQCRCLKGDRICGNRHEWHLCLAHEDLRIVIGPADHRQPTLECSCLPSKQDEALRQAAHLEDDPHG